MLTTLLMVPGEADAITVSDNMYQIMVRATERRASDYTGPAMSSIIGVTVDVQDKNEARDDLPGCVAASG